MNVLENINTILCKCTQDLRTCPPDAFNERSTLARTVVNDKQLSREFGGTIAASRGRNYVKNTNSIVWKRKSAWRHCNFRTIIV